MMTIKSQIIKQSVKTAKATKVLNKDMVAKYDTNSLGGGLWSIEAVGHDNSTIIEFIGSNGTLSEADDLWEEVSVWEKDPRGGLAVHHWLPSQWQLPDGSTMGLKRAQREIEKGHLHGLLLEF